MSNALSLACGSLVRTIRRLLPIPSDLHRPAIHPSPVMISDLGQIGGVVRFRDLLTELPGEPSHTGGRSGLFLETFIHRDEMIAEVEKSLRTVAQFLKGIGEGCDEQHSLLNQLLEAPLVEWRWDGVNRDNTRPECHVCDVVVRLVPVDPDLLAALHRDIRFSRDYRSCRWGSHNFFFTAAQAAVVRALDEERRQGTPELSDMTLLDVACSASLDVEGRTSEKPRFRNVFRSEGKMHAAWDKMIVEGHTKGTHRLADPPPE